MTDQARPKMIALAAGGTGGHVFPAVALAKQLVERGYDVTFITDARGANYGGLPEAVTIYTVDSRGVAGKSFIGRLMSIPALGLGFLQARGILKKIKPAVVVGFGGYPSLPPLIAANTLNIPTVIHEQNAILGRANRLLAKRAAGVATSFVETDLIPAIAEAHVRHVGMPVREEVIAARDVSYPDLNETGPVKLLIMGGSQGARVLSEVVPQGLTKINEGLRSRLQVQQQCRPEDIDAVRAIYRDAGIEAELATFFDDIPQRLATCHLLISRSGASSVAEALVVGRPSVLVPYAYAIDDHQTANAHAVDDCGGGWLMEQMSFASETLSSRLNSLFNLSKTLKLAADNARSAGIPDAASRLADMVLSQIETNGNGGSQPETNTNKNEEAA